MSDSENNKISPADFVTILRALDSLVQKGLMTREEGYATADRIYVDSDIQEFEEEHQVFLGHLSGPGKAKGQDERQAVPRQAQGESGDPDYVSLTDIARAHSSEKPGHTIQSWLRSENTLAFLDLWEREYNPDYDFEAYSDLMERKKSSSFTITPKQWIERTKATGLTSRQGKSGGTFAHPMIAREFSTWLSPCFKLQLLKRSRYRENDTE